MRNNAGFDSRGETAATRHSSLLRFSAQARAVAALRPFHMTIESFHERLDESALDLFGGARRDHVVAQGEREDCEVTQPNEQGVR